MTVSTKLAVLSITIAATAAPAARQIKQNSPAPLGILKVAGGRISGAPAAGGRISAYKGIPFAAPPVAELRWRAPQAVRPWKDVRLADAFAASCVQNIVDVRKPWTYEFMAHGRVSEDCLYLNVWTPARSASERNPVLVFIHGGANTEGSGSVPVYDGEGLAAKGVVAVTINYRLGVLGFLAHPELTKEAPYHASGNYGLLDQIAAVRWVRDNIAAFGGDPRRIAVAGQSAGAAAVRNLLISPLAKGTFQRAIAESGASVTGFGSNTRTLADAEQSGLRFSQEKGARSLADLRAMSWQQLVAQPAAPGGAPAGAPPFRWGTILDGHALTVSEAEAFASGSHNDVPVLAGSNKDEGGAVPKPATTLEAYRKQAEQRYGDRAAEFLKLYPAASDEEAGAAQNESARDQSRVGTYLWAARRAKTARTKTFTYFWTHALPGPDSAQYGAFHTSEVPYVLNTLAMSDRPFSDADRKIADTMSSYWANFAATGDPNLRELATWPSVGESPDKTMAVGDSFEPIPLAGSPGKLKFWTALLERPRQPVTVTETDVVIPTYLAGDPEPNPMFFFGRQSQGAEGRVYPYPLYDVLTHRKADRTYRLIYLENEYVRIGILPEIGGRVFEGYDKTNNYHFFYRQHVIKPALIGLIGAWISGGIEWNIPHHHRATTFLPVQYRIEEGSDGSRTVWVGELEVRQRMRWAVGYTLRPGRSVLEATVRIVNRTPVANTMLAFANVAVHVNDQYQVVFPPRTQLGTHHHKRQFTKWPIADSRYGGGDFSGGVDISWYKNHVAANSVFAWNSDEDFVAGYDHGKDAGTMAIADHHVVPGKKFWTWGNGPRGRMWDRILTDGDGPYMEIMVGGYSDNQPDYSWLEPFETKSFTIFWYPFRAIGGAKQANVDAAVNLEVRSGTAKVGFCTTSAFDDAVVRLAAKDRVLLEQRVSIDPAHPFVRDVPLPGGVAELDLKASLRASGRELVSYQPVRLDPAQMPAPVTDPPAPAAIESIDELFQTGLWIEQFHNASLEPDPYWKEALRRDPGNTQVHTAFGINRFKKARYKEAEQHLRAALARLNVRYAVPKDAEATYYLGLALKAQGKHDEALDLFYKSTWDMAWRAPAYYEAAEIATLRGDSDGALACTDRSLEANGLNLRAWNLKAALLRRTGRKDAALAALAGNAHAIDPLDARAMAERWLLTRQDDDARQLRATLGAHRALAEELGAEYLNAGLWQDGSDVLAQAADEPAKTSPMVYYYLAYFARQLGREDGAERYYSLAAQASPAYVFPFEAEAEIVLRAAAAANPRDARALYYLGNLLYDWQPDRAVEAWEEFARLDPSFPIVHRNLAVAYAHSEKPDAKARAIASLEEAISLPGARYAVHFAELDRLYEETGKPPEQRLKLFEANQQVIAQRDDALAREISLKVFAGKLDDAIRLLGSREFSVWEGGTLNVRDPWTDAHILKGHQLRAAGRHRQAIAAYGAALAFPDNLASERLDSSARSAEVVFWTGIARDATGDRAGARREWEAAAAAQKNGRAGAPERADQRFYQAQALRRLGREQAARERLESLLEISTRTRDEAMAHYLAGLAHLGLDQQEQGKKELTRALELRPDLLAAKMALEPRYSIRIQSKRPSLPAGPPAASASLSAPPR